MRYFTFFIIFFIAFSTNVLSQEDTIDSIGLDVIVDDSLYYNDYDENDIQEDSNNEDYQEEEYLPSGYLAEINMSLKKPAGLMNEKFTSVPFGISLSFYKQVIKSLPFYLGIGVFLEQYASESVFYSDYSSVDGISYEYSEDFTADMFGLNIGAKYFSTKSFWIFNPYVQVDMEWRRGFAVINTVNLDLDETENTDFVGGNSGFGYDFGVGSFVDLGSENIYLNFKISYNSGGGLFLYHRNKMDNASYAIDYFDYKYVPIGFLTFKIGVAFL